MADPSLSLLPGSAVGHGWSPGSRRAEQPDLQQDQALVAIGTRPQGQGLDPELCGREETRSPAQSLRTSSTSPRGHLLEKPFSHPESSLESGTTLKTVLTHYDADWPGLGAGDRMRPCPFQAPETCSRVWAARQSSDGQRPLETPQGGRRARWPCEGRNPPCPVPSPSPLRDGEKAGLSRTDEWTTRQGRGRSGPQTPGLLSN